MLAHARQRATDLGRTVELREADAQALPLPDASFDTVACTLALCSIPDPRAAIDAVAEHRKIRMEPRVAARRHKPRHEQFRIRRAPQEHLRSTVDRS